MHIRYSMEVLIHQYVLILKQFMRHFMEVLSVMFCILSDIGSSSKEQTVDVTINPESCRPEVSKFFFCNFPFSDFRGLWICCAGYVKKLLAIFEQVYPFSFFRLFKAGLRQPRISAKFDFRYESLTHSPLSRQ